MNSKYVNIVAYIIWTAVTLQSLANVIDKGVGTLEGEVELTQMLIAWAIANQYHDRLLREEGK